jgi:hypothetical protein
MVTKHYIRVVLQRVMIMQGENSQTLLKCGTLAVSMKNILQTKNIIKT